MIADYKKQFAYHHDSGWVAENLEEASRQLQTVPPGDRVAACYACFSHMRFSRPMNSPASAAAFHGRCIAYDAWCERWTQTLALRQERAC